MSQEIVNKLQEDWKKMENLLGTATALSGSYSEWGWIVSNPVWFEKMKLSYLIVERYFAACGFAKEPVVFPDFEPLNGDESEVRESCVEVEYRLGEILEENMVNLYQQCGWELVVYDPVNEYLSWQLEKYPELHSEFEITGAPNLSKADEYLKSTDQYGRFQNQISYYYDFVAWDLSNTISPLYCFFHTALPKVYQRIKKDPGRLRFFQTLCDWAMQPMHRCMINISDSFRDNNEYSFSTCYFFCGQSGEETGFYMIRPLSMLATGMLKILSDSVLCEEVAK